MSEWRIIWAKSIKANKALIKSRGKGEAEFKRLFILYPNDGMIFYSRGEAYEYLLEYELAVKDYGMARDLFPAPHWQRVAQYAIERVEQRKSSGDGYVTGRSWWDYLHRVYGVVAIPHKIRVDILSAIERFDSEPHLSAGLLRMNLEELVNYLLEKASIPNFEDEELEKKIDIIEANNLITPGIASKMQIVRDRGNKCVHREKDVGDINFYALLDNFVEVIEGLGEK